MSSRLELIAKLILLVGLSLSATPANAVWLTNLCTADTSLIEVAPSNNNGGQAWVLSGRTQNGPRNRGLYKFDLANLSSNAIVQAGTLVLEVTGVPAEPPVFSAFGLRRILRPWGEGDKAATGSNPPGRGLLADAGQATWLYANFPTNAWSAPGGAAGVDFSSVESSFQFIYGLDVYRFESTPEMVADLQEWVNHPEANFGWLLLCSAEDSIFTARRFGSREDGSAPPRLELQFFVPPRIESAQIVGSEFQLSFTTWPGQNYAVEFRSELAFGSWQSLTNIGFATNAAKLVVVDAVAAPQHFYRVVAF